MAKNRYVNTKFWSDNFVSELNALDRYLFLYFLTNEHTKICGVYEVPLRNISFETGIETDMLKKMLKKLDGRVYYIDGWVYVKNFAKHQSCGEKIKKGIENSLNEVPESIRLKIDKLDSLSIGSDSLSIGCELLEPKPKLKSKPKLEHKLNNSKELEASPQHGNKEINEVFEFIKSETGTPAVSGQQSRRYAYNLLRSLKKNYPDEQEVPLFKKIIQLAVGLNDTWHSTKAHDPKHLFYNWQEIIKLSKSKTTSIPDFSQ